MSIPFSYNLRNLLVRKTTTMMTALGIALTVAVLLAVLALVEGLRTSFQATGHPLHLLVTRKGSTSELTSFVTRTVYQDLRSKAGIARTPDGQSMASLEMVTGVNLDESTNAGGMNINLRGLSLLGVSMRPELRLKAGRMFTPGRREVIIGKNLDGRYPRAKLGGKLEFGRGQWEVVGIFDAGRSALNSEILADLEQVSSDYTRTTVLSSILVRAADEVTRQALRNDLEQDQRLNVSAVPEREYYAAQMTSAIPIQFLGTLISVVLAIGSTFAAMNTMYAAVSRRSAEIGTLRVLGFSRTAILMSFVLESGLLSLLGGVIGCLLALPLNNFQTGIGSFVTFSEIVFSFHVTPQLMLFGLIFSLVMGIGGGLLPARSAARREILTALRAA